MKRSILQRFEVCALTTLICACALIPSTISQVSDRPLASTVEARIQRVENGLLQPTILKGEAAPKMKLLDRMQF
jgi:hypothetical protein